MKTIKKEQRGQEFQVSNFYADGYPQPDPFSEMTRAYNGHVWVYACVKAIATNLASLPIAAYRKQKDGTYKEFPKNPLMPAILNPNPYMSTRDMIVFTSACLDLTGNCYWGLERESEKAEIREAYPLPPGDVKIVGSKDKLIDHYNYKVGSQIIRYEPWELIQFKEVDPNDRTYGLGAIIPAKLSVLTDIFAQTYNKMFYKNNARPDCVLETEQNVDETVAKRIMASWKAAHESHEKRGKTALMTNGVKYREVNRTPKDIDFLEGRKQNREEILAAFGVPPVIVGIFEYANYANSKEQIQIFWKHTLLPRADLIEQTLTRWSKQYTDDVESEISLDTDEVEALRVDENQRATTAKVYVDMGIPVNRVIEALDLPFDPVEGGDVPRAPAPSPFAPVPTAPPAKAIRKDLSPKEIHREMLWKKFDQRFAKHESAMHFAVRAFFNGQRRRVLKEWEAHAEKILAGRIEKQAETASLNIEMIFNLENEQKKMGAATGKIIRGTYIDFAVSVAKKVAPEISFDVTSPLVQHWIESRTFQLAKQANTYTLEKITEAVVDGVEEAVAEGWKMGESIQAIADRITDVYDFAAKGRAERIAQTETNTAANMGSLEGMKQAGVEKKQWLAVRDSRTRDTHRELDEDIKGIDEDFVTTDGNHLIGPGDPNCNAPEEIVNCRCTMIPIFPEEEQ